MTPPSGELAHILSPLSGHASSCVKNSTHFINQVCELFVDNDDILVSFDVVSLFAKVRVDDALDEISQHLMADEALAERTPISPG